MIFIMGKRRGEGPGEKASGFACMGSCLNHTTGLSSHLSPESLNELKCKSQKLNPWVL